MDSMLKVVCACVCVCVLTGCEGCELPDAGLDLTNGVDPGSGVPATLVDEGGIELWQVGWDNPVVSGYFEQLPNQGSNPGYAYRPSGANGEGLDWSQYGLFDLDALVISAAGNDMLYTWPTGPGFYGDDETSFFWEAHGLALEPRLTAAPLEAVTVVQALRDDYNTGVTPYKLPGTFELDPQVRLVPLHVIVLYPSDGSFAHDWFSEQDAEVLFDDRWYGDKDTTSDPVTGASPETALVTWTNKPDCSDSWCGTWASSNQPSAEYAVQPDRVFDKCGVQFRMVSFLACPVPPEVWAPPLSDVCDGGSHVTSDIKNALVASCVGYPQNPTGGGFWPYRVHIGPLRLYPPNCAVKPYGLTRTTSRDVYVSREAMTWPHVLNHELGHSLGLNPTDSLAYCHHGDPDQDPELMCNDGPWNMTDAISEQDCSTAWNKASQDHFAYWQ